MKTPANNAIAPHCHAAEMAREYHALYEALDGLDNEHFEAKDNAERTSQIERLQEHVSDALSRIQVAVSYVPAFSAEGALFQLGLISGLADEINNRGEKNPWPSDDSIVEATRRITYSIADFIRAAQKVPDHPQLDYFFPLRCNPYRVLEHVEAEKEAGTAQMS